MVQKIFGPKIFGFKKFLVQKNSGVKKNVSKKFGSEKVLGSKHFGLKKIWCKKFSSKKVWVQSNFQPKRFWVQINLGQTGFWVQNFLVKQNVGLRKLKAPKKFYQTVWSKLDQ